MKIINKIVSYKIRKGYIKNEHFNHKYILNGGKKFKINLNSLIDKKIVFTEKYNDGFKKILLNSKKNNNIFNCVSITIKDNFAFLDSLQVSEGNCIDLDDFGLKTTGKFHLKVAIKMLKKYKNKFKINKIVLEDIATVKCNEEDFPLSSYLLLTKGYTFYGKEGFKYQKDNLNKLLKNYQKYIDKLKAKNVNIKKMLNKHNNKNINKKINNLLKENPEIKFINLLGIIFNRDNMINLEICQLYMYLRNVLIKFYIDNLGNEYLDLFMPNLKMEMIL